MGRGIMWVILMGSVALGALSFGAQAQSDSASADARLTVELNRLETAERGCRFTFVMRNGLPQPIDQLGLEIAMFGPDGAVTGVVTLDAGALPRAKTRVKRFIVPDIACDNVTRVLLNDVTACEGEALSPQLCIGKLDLSTRVAAEFML